MVSVLETSNFEVCKPIGEFVPRSPHGEGRIGRTCSPRCRCRCRPSPRTVTSPSARGNDHGRSPSVTAAVFRSPSADSRLVSASATMFDLSNCSNLPICSISPAQLLWRSAFYLETGRTPPVSQDHEDHFTFARSAIGQQCVLRHLGPTRWYRQHLRRGCNLIPACSAVSLSSAGKLTLKRQAAMYFDPSFGRVATYRAAVHRIFPAASTKPNPMWRWSRRDRRQACFTTSCAGTHFEARWPDLRRYSIVLKWRETCV